MRRIDAGIPEWAEEGTLLLRIPPQAWAPPLRCLELDRIAFQPKHELHVTLVGRALAADLHAAATADAGIREAIEQLRSTFDGQFARHYEWLRLEKVEDERIAGSIIERIDLPSMAGLHKALGTLLGRTLPVPPPHVTLYTSGEDRGIGVPDPATLESLKVREVHAWELGLSLAD